MNDVPAKSIPDTFGPDADEAAIAEEKLEEIAGQCEAIRKAVAEVFIGPSSTIESLLVALAAGGHILLEGVPGVAKTTLCRSFAATLGAGFRRIQFTPDLLPSDITGTYVPDLRNNEFHLRKGPVFTNVLLGDEINRAPAKTQSALLEAMQERQVTIEGNTQILPSPFIVLATQNPVEQQGVYPLPEAQLDRFLLKVVIGYPSEDQELEILQTHRRKRPAPEEIIGADEVNIMSELVEKIYVSEEMMRYVIDLVRHTRDDDLSVLGGSPRASLALLRASQARALIRGRAYVVPDDVRALALNVLAHRVLLHPDAELDGTTGEDVVRRSLKSVRYG